MADEDPIIGDAPPRSNVLFSNAVYDKLKWLAQVVLPAIALFYITVAPLWGLPKQEEVAGTVVALDLALGTILGISNKMYKNSPGRYAGHIVYERIPGAETAVNLVPKSEWKDYENRDEVVFKVNRR